MEVKSDGANGQDHGKGSEKVNSDDDFQARAQFKKTRENSTSLAIFSPNRIMLK